MRFHGGEIFTSPKIIYWIGPPEQLTRGDIVDVLKNDLLIIPCDARFTSFHLLKKTAQKRTLYFFNLDHIIIENKITKKHLQAFAVHLADFFHTLTPAKCLVYGGGNRDIFEPAFSSRTLFFQESPFTGNHALPDSIHHITDTLFLKDTDKEQTSRAAYRLFLLPLKYTVKARIRGGEAGKALDGYVKDLSLNGACFILKKPEAAPDFQKDTGLTLQLLLHRKTVRINSCFVTRINPADAEIGVRYDINDQESVSEEHGDILSGLMYTWLKQVVRQLAG